MEKSIDEIITENLRYEIEKSGIPKKKIAQEMGVDPSCISQYCSGLTQPTLANLVRLCRVIDCSADEILGLKQKS